MENLFYNKSNFEMLYKVIDNDMNQRYDISLDTLKVNARGILYDCMINVFLKRSSSDTIETLNKSVLKICIPFLIQHKETSIVADEKVQVFNEEELKEDINGTNLNLSENDTNRPKIEYIEEELDLNSGDRREWKKNSSNGAYCLDVNLGASSSFDGIGTDSTFKNIIAINVTHVILPDIESDSIDKYPFLYLQIDELSGIYQSSSNQGRKALVKLLRDKKWHENENINSNVYINLLNTKGGSGSRASVGWSTTNPIASLSKMSIKILNPSGFVLKKLEDVFEIQELVYDASGIQIACDEFSEDMIHIGNRIGFKEVVTGVTELDTYLMENEHIVLSTLETGSNYYFTIKGPNTTTPYVNLTNITGKLLNLSRQSSFGFCIKTIKYDYEEEPRIV